MGCLMVLLRSLILSILGSFMIGMVFNWLLILENFDL